MDGFKEMVAMMIQEVEAGEPGYLGNEWYLSDDERTRCTTGLLRDSEAVMAHPSPPALAPVPVPVPVPVLMSGDCAPTLVGVIREDES